MDSLIKALSLVIPFLGKSPTWFQVLFVAWVGATAIVFIVAFVLALQSPTPTPAPAPFQLSSSVVKAPGEQRAFVVLLPQEGTLVEVGDTVEFVSPYGALKHYVVVTPLQTSTRWVVDGLLTVVAGEHEHGNARFGDTRAGRGERYSLQILATAELLRQGVLEKPPVDARFSASIKVIRAR